MSDGIQRPAFRRLHEAAARVAVVVDGETLQLPEGEPLAAALLAEGRLATSHSLELGEPRGPLCLMGTCGQCACEIDGLQHQRSCRTVVREGLEVNLRIVRRSEAENE